MDVINIFKVTQNVHLLKLFIGRQYIYSIGCLKSLCQYKMISLYTFIILYKKIPTKLYWNPFKSCMDLFISSVYGTDLNVCTSAQDLFTCGLKTRWLLQ